MYVFILFEFTYPFLYWSTGAHPTVHHTLLSAISINCNVIQKTIANHRHFRTNTKGGYWKVFCPTQFPKYNQTSEFGGGGTISWSSYELLHPFLESEVFDPTGQNMLATMALFWLLKLSRSEPDRCLQGWPLSNTDPVLIIVIVRLNKILVNK